ncbi:MerR family transcriptional regulator [Cryptosporangium arvum]|uniref:Putative transcriptional regulator n=1 Tax=Cryptosporangium arvum DSM 44712 TaxID=927661 RepID=A0A010ZZM1_9ACTN|nr:MerR family transcriptional regulator [Cryptosporangium arvum]EXG82672.1 putative transcriptional regulator [Cryptosporangium arvum DSM 44712]
MVATQEVARRSGPPEATLRYYERIGLIAPVPRDESSGHRRYDPDTVRTIEAPACLRTAGMGIDALPAYIRSKAIAERAAWDHAAAVGADLAVSRSPGSSGAGSRSGPTGSRPQKPPGRTSR